MSAMCLTINGIVFLLFFYGISTQVHRYAITRSSAPSKLFPVGFTPGQALLSVKVYRRQQSPAHIP